MSNIHRLSALITAKVLDAQGNRIGQIREVRLSRSASDAALNPLTINGFFVTPRKFGAMFGFAHQDQQGPLFMSLFIRAWHKNDQYIPLEQVDRIDWDDPICVHLKPS